MMSYDKKLKIIKTGCLFLVFTLFIVTNNRIYFHFVDAVFHGIGPSVFEEFMFNNFIYFTVLYGIIAGIITVILLTIIKIYYKYIFFIGSIFLLYFLIDATFVNINSIYTLGYAYLGGITVLLIALFYEFIIWNIKKKKHKRESTCS